MEFINSYFTDFTKCLETFTKTPENLEKLQAAVDMIKATKPADKKLIIIGNGGSSAIAEHMAIDFTKNANLKAIAFSGTPMLTTFANDYGYENVFSTCIEKFMDRDDVVIAISSSGTSKNIIRACDKVKNGSGKLITFTGFEKENPVSSMGDLNFYIESRAFGFVEIIHNLLIHCVNDAVIGEQEYFIKGDNFGG